MAEASKIVFVPIKDVTHKMKKLHAKFIVLEPLNTVATPEGTAKLFLVADETASMHLCCWDRYSNLIHSGDILQLTNGYCSLYKGSPTIYVGAKGKVEKVGEYMMVFSEQPNKSLEVIE